VPLLITDGVDQSLDTVDFAGNGGSFANSGRANLAVFTYSIVVGSADADRTLIGSCSVLTAVQWFTSAAGASASHTGVAVSTTDASVFVAGIPAPGALALLGLGGLVATRRRR
jgi:MYXO-CTERM domain-containing protein